MRYGKHEAEVTWNIRTDATGYFWLEDDKGKTVREGETPLRLSQWGLDNGATHVRWDFDLKLAE